MNSPALASPRSRAGSPSFRRAASLALALLAAVSAVAADAPALPEPERINVGIFHHALPISENDAKASISTLARSASGHIERPISASIDLFDRVEELRKAIEGQRLHLVFMTLWEYCQLGVDDRLEIVSSTVVAGQVSTRYLLLARADRPLRSLADLRGKSLFVLGNSAATFGHAWLDTLLVASGVADASGYFSSVATVLKPSAAALPVFFGKADACIIDEASFETLKTLNPQLGRTLAIIDSSEPLPYPVLCATRGGWFSGQLRQDLIRRFNTLHESPVGRQLLTIFKCDRLQPFAAEQLAQARALYLRQQQLRASTPAP